MKAYTKIFVLFAFLFFGVMQAQRGSSATVTAQNHDISDNLDLQAVASVFGESNDLEDFERRLNDPSLQLSNLDLNGDGYVDYLRVIEVAEGNNRIIVIQSVLGQDLFQDVATIEIERQRQRSSNNNTNIHVQIVGNPYLYGPNYIYEPFFYRTPVFFDYFWMSTYRPYFSPWYWGYYPTYFNYWAPMSPYHYHRHVYSHINARNRFVYTEQRRMSRADRIYGGVSRNAYERTANSRSFASRNNNASNRYVLENSRGVSRNENGIVARSRTADTGVRGTSANSSSRALNQSERTRLNTDLSTSRSTATQSRNNISSETITNRSSNVQNNGARVRSDFQVGTGTGRNSNENAVSTGRNSARVQTATPARNTNVNSGGVNSSQRIERSTTPSRNSVNTSTSTSPSSSRSSNTVAPTSSNISRGTSSNVSRSTNSSMSSSRGMSTGSSSRSTGSSSRGSR